MFGQGPTEIMWFQQKIEIKSENYDNFETEIVRKT